MRNFLRYAKARIKERHKEELWRNYIADGVRAMSESNALIVGEGQYLSMSFRDVLNPKVPDLRTGEEIAADVIARAGLVVM